MDNGHLVFDCGPELEPPWKHALCGDASTVSLEPAASPPPPAQGSSRTSGDAWLMGEWAVPSDPQGQTLRFAAGRSVVTRDGRGDTMLGRYELTGDRVTVQLAGPSGQRKLELGILDSGGALTLQPLQGGPAYARLDAP